MRKILFVLISFIANMVWAQKNNEVVVKSMQHFDIARYSGTWYEIARLPVDSEDGCFKNIKIDYIMKGDSGYNINISCLSEENKYLVDHAVAKFMVKDNAMFMSINFASWWIRWTGYGSKKYIILDTDYDTYAVIGSPDHENAWIFSRAPNMKVEQVQGLVQYLHSNGYDVSNIIYDRTSMQ